MVHYDTAYGVMGLAFHPNFTSNGCLTQTTSCFGRYQGVISEFIVNGFSSITSSEGTSAIPSEVKRIFTMGLPYTEHHGGQILFGPEDGYLYFMLEDGGNGGDLSTNKLVSLYPICKIFDPGRIFFL
ncbi:hypothetical protein KFK09_025892 [Dendrobium nobile]|uniref:Glucose/Sorbosone dehydrogenase domain-containing protein n=1 Tax=Dendrobium nobile TaxID=94219 RepID=A0A8T3A751_DENNO|nr:hypothetical protein KFK09_025892 [Dendrobium nobile]